MLTPTNEDRFANDVLGAETPVLVDFWAEWCQPCKALDVILEDVAETMGEKVRIVSVNAEDNPGIVARYNVRSMPTLVLFSGGEPADMRVGAAQSRAGLIKWLESHAA